MQARRRKFKRDPNNIRSRNITECSLAIIATIERYGLIPCSLLVRLVPFNEDVVNRRMRDLYDLALINRFTLPRSVGPHGEFIYYLDNPKALQLLIELGNVSPEALDRGAVWRNREKGYAAFLNPAKTDRKLGSIFYIDHELMISRFHAMLELACRGSNAQLELAAWRQGPELWRSIMVPKLIWDRERRRYVQDEGSDTLPYRPDAFFTLHFPNGVEGQQQAHFFYEADRKTTDTSTFKTKLRAYFQFIAREKKHREEYGIHRVRAVLVETLDRHRAELLRATARDPVVCGNAPTPLFWFTTSELFTKKDNEQGRSAHFLTRPQVVLDRVWLPSTTNTFCSLMD